MRKQGKYRGKMVCVCVCVCVCVEIGLTMKGQQCISEQKCICVFLSVKGETGLYM